MATHFSYIIILNYDIVMKLRDSQANFRGLSSYFLYLFCSIVQIATPQVQPYPTKNSSSLHPAISFLSPQMLPGVSWLIFLLWRVIGLSRAGR